MNNQLNINKKLLDLTKIDNQTDRQAFLYYAMKCILSLIDHNIIFFANDNSIIPNAIRFKNIDRSFSIVPFPHIEKTTNQHLLISHLTYLLDLSVPIIQNQEIFNANYTLQLTDEKISAHWQINIPSSIDYRFQFPIIHSQQNNLLGYCAALLNALQDVVEFLIDDIPYFIDAISFKNKKKFLPSSFPYQPFDLGMREDGNKGTGEKQPLNSVSATEPSIVCLAFHWGLFAKILSVASQPAAIDGFSLLRASDWVVSSSRDPSQIYEYLGRICNVACKFCYLFGNPSQISIARGKKVILDDELNTRIRYFNPQEGKALFQAHWEINEILVDPKLKKTLTHLRQISSQPFYFITNGNPLKPDIIDFFATVKPVHLVISTNTLDHIARASIMQESQSRTRIAYSALDKLHEKEIPYGVSLVAFPAFPLEKLEETIFQLNILKPAFIRINLHGFTRNHPYQEVIDDNRFWSKVVPWVQGLRKKTNVPLILIPSAYEQNFFYRDPNAPRIIGTVPGSPAAFSDLKPDDVIKKINIFPIQTRSQLISILMLQKGNIQLEVEREGKILTLKLNPAQTSPSYPGSLIAKYFFPYGIVIPPSISLSDVEKIRRKIDDKNANKAWIITSRLMLPSVEQLIQQFAFDILDKIDFVLVDNHFLGGNIQVLDMATIGDIARAIDKKLQTHSKPDVIFLPATGFNRLGRDITGRHWNDLTRWYDFDIELLVVTTRFAY